MVCAPSSFAHRQLSAHTAALLVLHFLAQSRTLATVVLDQSAEHRDKQHRRSESHVQADGDAPDLRVA
jgi:hypothetical protein